MALTITEILRSVLPNVGLVVNPDGSYRIGVEDVNSDEILAAVEASAVDLAALEVLLTAINTALQAGGITQAQLAAILAAVAALETDIVLAAGTNAIGNVGHNITGIASSNRAVTTAGTRVTLTAASTPAKYVKIQAKPANTGRIAVGGSSVDETPATVDGLILYAAENSGWIPCDDLVDIYLDSSVSAEGVTYIYLT